MGNSSIVMVKLSLFSTRICVKKQTVSIRDTGDSDTFRSYCKITKIQRETRFHFRRKNICPYTGIICFNIGLVHCKIMLNLMAAKQSQILVYNIDAIKAILERL